MNRSFYSPLLLTLVSFLILNTAPVFGQATTAAPKVKKLPFHGQLAAVDTTAQTITLSGKTARVFHLTPTTIITDGAGAPSTLSAAVVGEDVGGSYSKDASGTMTLFSVRFGAKAGSKAATTTATASTPAPAAAPATPPPVASTPAPAAAPAAAATTAAKAKSVHFSGKVVSVNATANTLVVHGKADQTFTATSATKITGADSLASVTAGAKVAGTYTKSTDGATMTLVTLKVSK